MKSRNLIITILVLLISAGSILADSSVLQIYLPRAIEVPAGQLSLGAIGVVRCGDFELAENASGIAMGRAPWHAEKITIDRRTVLSRLASHGISPRKVTITGAQRVEITLSERVVPGKELLIKAEAFLKELRPVPPGCTWEVSSPPKDLILPAGAEMDLQARLLDDRRTGILNVMVEVVSVEKVLASKKLTFKVFFPNRQILALRAIANGEKLTEENIKITTVSSPRPESTEFVNPFGMILRHRIQAGSVIRPHMLTEPTPPMLVKRNQGVVMRIEGEGFRLMGMGVALEDGRLGQLIRVRNTDSSQVITAKVAADGAVEPIF